MLEWWGRLKHLLVQRASDRSKDNSLLWNFGQQKVVQRKPFCNVLVLCCCRYCCCWFGRARLGGQASTDTYHSPYIYISTGAIARSKLWHFVWFPRFGYWFLRGRRWLCLWQRVWWVIESCCEFGIGLVWRWIGQCNGQLWSRKLILLPFLHAFFLYWMFIKYKSVYLVSYLVSFCFLLVVVVVAAAAVVLVLVLVDIADDMHVHNIIQVSISAVTWDADWSLFCYCTWLDVLNEFSKCNNSNTLIFLWTCCFQQVLNRRFQIFLGGTKTLFHPTVSQGFTTEVTD